MSYGRSGCALWAALVSLFFALSAAADPTTLRISTIAPQGSGWARELAAFGREVESASNGGLRAKFYYGGIAGDEVSVLDRIRRDQLDGAIGSEMCVRISPSMKVTRIAGMFGSRDESAYVVTRLRPKLDAEFLRAGFINMGEATLGPELLFTRKPVHDMAELKRTPLWTWDLDAVLTQQMQQIGLQVVPTPIDQAAKAYDDKRTDGFIAIPTGALAFQWTTQAGYLEALRISYRTGCLFFASRAFDALPIEQQQILRGASGKLRARMDELGGRQDDALLSGLFSKQGLQSVPVSERFRIEFFDAAREVRQRLGASLVSAALLDEVLSWLADYRAEHPLAR